MDDAADVAWRPPDQFSDLSTTNGVREVILQARGIIGVT